MIFIPSGNTDLSWAERYTRGQYKQKNSEELTPYQRVYMKYLLDPEEQKTPLVVPTTGEELSLEDSIKLAHCITCDKEFVNNARRYCINCEYYSSKFD